jgi:hypothetical protein
MILIDKEKQIYGYNLEILYNHHVIGELYAEIEIFNKHDDYFLNFIYNKYFLYYTSDFNIMKKDMVINNKTIRCINYLILKDSGYKTYKNYKTILRREKLKSLCNEQTFK